MKNKKIVPPQSYWHSFIPQSWMCLKSYSWNFFRSDLIAGITVGIVALPLAMAFAIASGTSPATGIYTAIVAGFLGSLFGGSSFQISGPTGAFVVVIFSILHSRGYDGLAVVTLLAGIILLASAFFKLGNLIKFIPFPLVTGFTSGIAIIIFFSQIKDFLGLQIDKVPAHFFPKCAALFGAIGTWDPVTALVATTTLCLIVFFRRFTPQIPWGITSIVLITILCSLLNLPIDTIFSRYGAIPTSLPHPTFPHLSALFTDWYQLFQDAFSIAFLAGVESLLSATVADGMTGHSHKSNSELLGQGIANLGSIFFGGIPATGAIARTAMNIRSGAKSPLAGMVHSVTLLLIIFFFAPLVSKIPLAALSAVLVMVAWNMSEVQHFRHLMKAPKGDVAVLLLTFFITVVVDLVVAIEVGMIFAAFLFMKRIRDLSGIKTLKLIEDESEMEKPDPDAIEKKHVPHGVEVYEIAGLFFFELAETLNHVLVNYASDPKVVILRMRHIPVIDASGMNALKEFYHKCKKSQIELILSGVCPSLFHSLKKFGIVDLVGQDLIFAHLDPSLIKAAQIVQITTAPVTNVPSPAA